MLCGTKYYKYLMIEECEFTTYEWWMRPKFSYLSYENYEWICKLHGNSPVSNPYVHDVRPLDKDMYACQYEYKLGAFVNGKIHLQFTHTGPRKVS